MLRMKCRFKMLSLLINIYLQTISSVVVDVNSFLQKLAAASVQNLFASAGLYSTFKCRFFGIKLLW